MSQASTVSFRRKAAATGLGATEAAALPPDPVAAAPRRKDLRAFSVQYHPEAAAGPHDSLYLFDRFTALMAP